MRQVPSGHGEGGPAVIPPPPGAAAQAPVCPAGQAGHATCRSEAAREHPAQPRRSRACAAAGTARRGTAALEFALVIPVLLLLLFGAIGFGIYLTYMHEVQELASGATRASIAGLTATERDTLAKQFVSTAVGNSALLTSSDMTVTTATSATNYSVTLKYDLKDTCLPVLASLISVKFNTITRTSTIVFGGY